MGKKEVICMENEKVQYEIKPATMGDIPQIVELLKTEPNAVIPLTDDQAIDRMDQGLLYVAKKGPKVIGVQGAKVWEESGVPELGSAVVAEEYRGNGINTAMKKVLIPIIIELIPDKPIMVFTEPASKSRGILEKLGFAKLPMEEVPEEFFTICPKEELGCYDITNKLSKPCSCGCIVYFYEKK